MFSKFFKHFDTVKNRLRYNQESCNHLVEAGEISTFNI